MSSGLELLEMRVLLSMVGQQLYPADNAWNQKVSGAPVASNSAGIINNIISRYGDGRFHPDFGQDGRSAGADLYGIAYNIVHGNSTAKVAVVIDAYPGESDVLAAPIPAGAVLEGDLQSGPRVGVDNRGDSHLLVWDEDNNVAYEFYRASRPSENGDGKWHADQETVWDMKSNAMRTIGFTSADAAGLSILAGLARPDEGLPVSQGGQGVINHAIRFTLQNAVVLNQFIYPASHVANAGNTNAAIQPPMGARFRLKASVDISGLNPEAKVIAQAMKDYGLILADNGSNFFISGASYAVDASNQFTLTWNDNDIQDLAHGLKSLHYSDFEVVDLTPVVTGISAASAAPGSQVMITGQNFAGAGGQLRVLFGSTAVTPTYIDDGHLMATVPAGTGTVNVQVKSGTTVVFAQNIRNPVFGYGVSGVAAAAQFTFSGTLSLLGGSGADDIRLEPIGSTLHVTIDGVLSTYSTSQFSGIRVEALGGNDTVTLVGLLPACTVFGGDGNDTVWGGDGNETVFGGAGDDQLHGGGGHDALRGEDGNDTLWGDVGDDRLYGDKGFDLLYGGDGSDRLDGGTGNDTMWGGRNADLLTGMGGNDVLIGEDGKDTLLGGDQNDTMDGGSGWDSLDGGAGDDAMFAIDGLTYTDTVVGGGGNDLAQVNELLDVVSGVGSVFYAPLSLPIP